MRKNVVLLLRSTLFLLFIGSTQRGFAQYLDSLTRVLETTKVDHTTKYSAFEQKYNQLNTNYATANTASSKVGVLENEIADLKKTLETTKSDHTNKYGELEQKHNELNASYATANAAAGKVGALENEITDLKKALETAKTEHFNTYSALPEAAFANA